LQYFFVNKWRRNQVFFRLFVNNPAKRVKGGVPCGFFALFDTKKGRMLSFGYFSFDKEKYA
jgi:hypothetical protein